MNGNTAVSKQWSSLYKSLQHAAKGILMTEQRDSCYTRGFFLEHATNALIKAICLVIEGTFKEISWFIQDPAIEDSPRTPC